MYTTNHLYFPHELIPKLRDQRGPMWQALVCRVMSLPECHEETIAFILMMSEINGCVPCETDSYRAMKGCDTCAPQMLRRHKGTDADLLDAYDEALARVREFVRSGDSLSGLIQRATAETSTAHVTSMSL